MGASDYGLYNVVGGIAGKGAPNNSYNFGTVTGNEKVGGLVGEGGSCDSENFGNISGKKLVGGICGFHIESPDPPYDIKFCRNNGTVKGETFVGGIAGSGFIKQ